LGVVVLAAALGAALVLIGRPSASTSPAPTVAAADGAAHEVLAASAAEPVAPTATQAQSAEQPHERAVGAASASRPTPLEQARKRSLRPSREARSAPPAKAASSCTPPFTVDAMGVKHAKLECL
jgi:hypothetical protein